MFTRKPKIPQPCPLVRCTHYQFLHWDLPSGAWILSLIFFYHRFTMLSFCVWIIWQNTLSKSNASWGRISWQLSKLHCCFFRMWFNILPSQHLLFMTKTHDSWVTFGNPCGNYWITCYSNICSPSSSWWSNKMLESHHWSNPSWKFARERARALDWLCGFY